MRLPRLRPAPERPAIRSSSTPRKLRRFTPGTALLEERALLSITIQIDYSLDTHNFFDTQAKRDVMQQAAETLGSALGDNLLAIQPAGGNTWAAVFPSPSTGAQATIENLSVPSNTIIVYVGGYALPGQGEAGDGASGGFSADGAPSWLNTVAARGQSRALAATPTDFGPWGGSISFDSAATNWYFGTTTAGLGPTQTDFLTVAEHELGHVLGIGTSASWQALSQPAGFVGPAAEAANGGQPVPLDPSAGHWAEGTTSDGNPATMTPVLLEGTRDVFTTLDYAGLEDIGWQFQAPVLHEPAPTINGIPDQAVIPGSTLSLTVPVNNQVAGRPLTYSLLGSPPPGATINPNTGLFSWTPSLGQAGFSGTILVGVEVAGKPALNDTQEFHVTVLVSPQITRMTLDQARKGRVNKGTTAIHLFFNEPMDPNAGVSSRYALMTPRTIHSSKKSNGPTATPVGFTSSYDPATNSVTLRLFKPSKLTLMLTVHRAVTAANGLSLAADVTQRIQ